MSNLKSNNLEFYKFLNKSEFEYYLEKSDLIMTKRNYFTSYDIFFGLIDSEGDLCAACVIEMDKHNIFIIKLFEVSKRFYRNGLGSKFFEYIKNWFYNQYSIHNITFELEALDDEAELFWEHLGFEPFENEDGDIRYRYIM